MSNTRAKLWHRAPLPWVCAAAAVNCAHPRTCSVPALEIAPGITADPTVRFGRPVIRGTRVAVETVVARVASGMPIADVAVEYGLTENDVFNALRYAARRLADERVWVSA